MVQHKTLKISALLLASAFSTMSYGAGFAVAEQSVTGLGRAFAGQAAVAEDASTIFFNPAGLTYLSGSELVVGVSLINPQSDFNNKGSTVPPLLGGTLKGREDDGGKLAAVPNFYYAHRINNDMVFGLGVNAPFGLVTDYSDSWVGRYHALKSDLKTININPSLGFKATDRLSLGFGVDLQYIDLNLTQAVDFGAACAANAVAGCAIPQGFDGKAKFSADDWSWGFNLGLIFQATDATRLALAYRSKISHHLTGKGKFNIPSDPSVQGLAAFDGGFKKAAISGDVTLPETLSFAINHQLNNQWSISADATWTRWERFKDLTISSPNPGSHLNTSKAENWHNVMRYGIGLTYIHNDKWTFRGGIAYDESPISDKYRTPRIPGEDRKWVALGASYKYSDHMSVDAGYTHIFVSDPKINDVNSSGYVLKGDFDASVDILGVQMRWLFL